MAKQRDDRKGPDEDPKGRKPKGKPEPFDDLDDLEEIEEAEVVEEPSTPPGMPKMSLEEDELPQAHIVDEAEEIAEAEEIPEADDVIMADILSDAPPAAVVVEEDLFAEEVEAPSGPGSKVIHAEEIADADEVEEADEVEDADEIEDADEVDDGLEVADEVAEADTSEDADEIADESDDDEVKETREVAAGSPFGETAALDFLTAEDLGDEKSGPGVPAPAKPVEAAEEVEEAFDFAGAREALEASTPKIAQSDSAVDLGGKQTTSERPSGVDELAEALESGVDLHRDAPSSKKIATISEDDIDLNAMMAEDESSAVDLGSPAKEKAPSIPDLYAETEEPPMPKKAKSVFDDDDSDKFGAHAEEAEEVAEEAEEVAEEAEEIAEEAEEIAEEAEEVAEEAEEVAEEAEEVAEEAEEVAEEVGADDATEIQDDLSKAFGEEFDQVKASDDEATAVDDEAAKLFEQADDEATMAWTGEKADNGEEVVEEAAEEVSEAVDETEEVSEAVEDDEPPVVTPKGKTAKAAAKKKPAPKAAVEDEDEDDDRGGTAVARKMRKPKYMRRWFGGFMLCLLMICGALAGIWYLAPDQLDEWLAYVPPSPRDTNKVSILGNIDDYKKAKRDLATTNDMMAKLTKDNGEKSVELDKAKDENKKLAKKIDGLQESEKVALELRDFLIKGKLIPDETDLKNLPNAMALLIKAKKEAEGLFEGIVKSLDDHKLIDKDKLDLASFQKFVKDFTDTKSSLAVINKKLEDAKFKDVDSLIAFKKDVEEKLSAVNKELSEAMVKDPGAKGVQQLIASRKKLEADRDDLETAIKTAYKELQSAKLAPEKGDPRKQILDAVKLARLKVESPLVIPLGQLANTMSGLGTGTASLVERSFDLAALLTEVNYYRIREPFVQTPVKQLDTWLALLQDRQFNNALSLAAADKDAIYVRSKDAKASKDARAKALYVSALILRNQEKYTEAKDLLEKAVKETADLKKTAWFELANQSLKELTDSSVYYLPRASKLIEQGNLKGALEILTTGLKAIPEDGRLLARRGLVRLELVRPEGKISTETQKDIRSDAQTATKDAASAAEAFFALGQLEETQGQWAKAEDDYRAALKSHKGDPEDASRYRIALARMLLMHDRPPSAPEETPEKEKEKDKGKEKEKDKGKDKEKEKEKDASLSFKLKDWQTAFSNLQSAICNLQSTIAVTLITGAQPGVDEEETPEAKARLKESIELAKELIKSDNPKTKGQGYMLLGQAYSKQGLRTKGLQEYVKGLQLLNPSMASKDLDKLVQDHPAFQQPDSLARPNPYLAERHFGRGLHYYWEKKYAEAEEQFKAAIGYFKKDARYHYYLGLSRLPQKGKLKRDGAVFAFEQGARLEQENPQSAYEVNASLERLQGALRVELNKYRQKGPE